MDWQCATDLGDVGILSLTDSWRIAPTYVNNRSAARQAPPPAKDPPICLVHPDIKVPKLSKFVTALCGVSVA